MVVTACIRAARMRGLARAVAGGHATRSHRHAWDNQSQRDDHGDHKMAQPAPHGEAYSPITPSNQRLIGRSYGCMDERSSMRETDGVGRTWRVSWLRRRMPVPLRIQGGPGWTPVTFGSPVCHGPGHAQNEHRQGHMSPPISFSMVASSTCSSNCAWSNRISVSCTWRSAAMAATSSPVPEL